MDKSTRKPSSFIPGFLIGMMLAGGLATWNVWTNSVAVRDEIIESKHAELLKRPRLSTISKLNLQGNKWNYGADLIALGIFFWRDRYRCAISPPSY